MWYGVMDTGDFYGDLRSFRVFCAKMVKYYHYWPGRWRQKVLYNATNLYYLPTALRPDNSARKRCTVLWDFAQVLSEHFILWWINSVLKWDTILCSLIDRHRSSCTALHPLHQATCCHIPKLCSKSLLWESHRSLCTYMLWHIWQLKLLTNFAMCA